MTPFDEADAGFYDAAYFAGMEARYQTGAHGSRVRHILACLGPLAGQRVLDLGCGGGAFSAVVARAGAAVVGLDYAADGIAHGRARHPELDLRCGSAYELDALFPAASFSRVLLIDVIEHLSDHEALLRGIRHVLEPTGRLVVSTDNEGCRWSRPPWEGWYRRCQRLSREGRAYRALKAAEAATPNRRPYHASHINQLGPWALRALLEQHGFRVVHHRTYAMVGVPLRDALLRLLPWHQRGDHQCVVAELAPAAGGP